MKTIGVDTVSGEDNKTDTPPMCSTKPARTINEDGPIHEQDRPTPANSLLIALPLIVAFSQYRLPITFYLLWVRIIAPTIIIIFISTFGQMIIKHKQSIRRGNFSSNSASRINKDSSLIYFYMYRL